jgi:hypothetical protein
VATEGLKIGAKLQSKRKDRYGQTKGKMELRFGTW